MSDNTLKKMALGVSGLMALAIGLAMLVAPNAFFASYGIALDSDASMLSELRALGANLAALGAVILAGAFVDRLAEFSAGLGALVFLAFASGRTASLLLDGQPNPGILGALGIELVLGIVCAAIFRSSLRKRDETRDAPGPILSSTEV